MHAANATALTGLCRALLPLGVLEGTHPVPGESDHVKLHAIACGQDCGLFNVSLQQSQASSPAHTHKADHKLLRTVLYEGSATPSIMDNLSDQDFTLDLPTFDASSQHEGSPQLITGLR